VDRSDAEHRPGQEADGSRPVVPVHQGFDAVYGLELIGVEAGEGPPEGDDARTLRGRVRVGAELLGAGGRLHGGVPAAIAESLASHGTAFATLQRGLSANGLSNDTTVIAPVAAGATLHAEAAAHSAADDYWVWSVELRDDDGTLCAFSRVTIAVRPLRR
jgi:1,4-dihydroxy-2-naphthoyl-CoA hydrolase